jgi:cellulose biosynthesis protein BcsQ
MEEGHGTPLRRFISRLKKIGRAHKDDFIASSARSQSADLRQFISQLKKIGRAHKHDFIVIDTPGGVQHLSLIAHGMADTLITPINDIAPDRSSAGGNSKDSRLVCWSGPYTASFSQRV